MKSQFSEFADMGQEDALNQALATLESGDFHQRWEAGKILTRLGRVAVEPLLKILEDEGSELELRWFVARILGQFESEAVIAALVRILQTSQNPETAEEVSLREIAAVALSNLGVSAIAPLTQLLQQEESRFLATEALTQIRHPQTIPALLEVAADPNPQIRALAIEALGSFHDQQVLPILLNALTDPVATVRKEAVIALGVRSDLLPEVDLVEKLKPLLWDIRPEVCQQAQLAMARLGTECAAAALLEQIQSEQVPQALKVEGIRALGWIESQTALDYLQDTLNRLSEEISLCQELITVLGRVTKPQLREQATNILIDFLSSHQPCLENPQIKQAIALALGHLGHPKAINSLIPLLADDNLTVRLHCIQALKQLAPQQNAETLPLHEQLQQLMNQDHLAPALKQGVSLALAEWT